MGKQFIQLCFAFFILLGSSQTMAMTDAYYATGEDLDFLIEADNSEAFREIEYELRKFVFFRKVEDYLINLGDSYLDGGH